MNKKIVALAPYVFQYSVFNGDARSSANVTVKVQVDDKSKSQNLTGGKQNTNLQKQLILNANIASDLELTNGHIRSLQWRYPPSLTRKYSRHWHYSKNLQRRVAPTPIFSENLRFMVTAKDKINNKEIQNNYFILDFDPKAIPNMLIWLKADAGITVVDGQVIEWQDQSGNDFHVYQAIYQAAASKANPPIEPNITNNNYRGPRFRIGDQTTGLSDLKFLEFWGSGASALLNGITTQGNDSSCFSV